jgi:hypothetical protein
MFIPYSSDAHEKSLFPFVTCIYNPYSDWLWSGRPRDRSWSPGRVKNFLFSTSSKPNVGLTQPSIQSVTGALFSVVKRPGRKAD